MVVRKWGVEGWQATSDLAQHAGPRWGEGEGAIGDRVRKGVRQRGGERVGSAGLAGTRNWHGALGHCG